MPSLRSVSVGVLVATCLAGFPLRSSLSPQDGTKTWDRIMYMGGAIGVRGKSEKWDSELTISPQLIKLSRKSIDGSIFEFAPSSVTGVTYAGQRRVNYTPGQVVGSPVLGLFVKSKDHYMTLDFESPDGNNGAVLLRLHKDDAQEIVDMVEFVLRRARETGR